MRLRLSVGVVAIAFLSHPGLLPGQEFEKRFAEPLRIAVRGKALNQDGQPIAGACIFVLSTNRTWPSDFERLISKTVTDAAGSYQLENVPLPMLAPDGTPIRKHVEGQFQVFGLASGYGFTWHEHIVVRATQRPAGEDVTPRQYFAGETCMADLAFEPAARLSGRVENDLKEPLAGVRVEVGLVRDIDRPSGMAQSRISYLTAPDAPANHFAGASYLPAETCSAVTDAEGRYVIKGLRRNSSYGVLVDYRPECDPLSTTIATASEAKGGSVRALGTDGTLDHSFVSPRKVIVRITSGNGSPVSGVEVRAVRQRVLRGGNIATTDADGQATLQLPPGEYALLAEPAIGLPYLAAESTLSVTSSAKEQTTTMSLKDGAVVVLKAIDAATGAPLAGVSFLRDSSEGTRRSSLHSQTIVADYPTTDEQGELRAVLEPGTLRVVVDANPPDYESLQSASKTLDLEAAKTRTLIFEFQRVENSKSPQRDLPEELARFKESYDQQRSLFRAGTYRIQSETITSDSTNPDDVLAAMRSWDEGRNTNLLEHIKAKLPGVNLFVNESLVTVDGLKHRVESTSELFDGRSITRVSISNGHENVNFDPSFNQASVTPAMVGTTRQVFGPSPSVFAAVPQLGRLIIRGPKPEVSHEGGKIIVQWSANMREVIDDRTGLLIESSSVGPNGFARYDWRFSPRVTPAGVDYMELSVQMQRSGERLLMFHVNRLKEVKFERPPAAAFLVAAPAGTLVVDMREGKSTTKMERLKVQVADVVTVANRLPKPRSADLPVIKVGQTAPPITAKNWLTSEGESAMPSLEGKVLLIDFWGTWCGPCVAELPDVQTLAKELAGDRFLLIGLHESRGEQAEVAEFAKKRGLTYQLAIDGPAAESLEFGATFKAFGVHAIPTCIVIDQQGKVAFVGRLDEASRAADRLLKATK